MQRLADITLPDLAATQRFATAFAPLLRPGDVVALDGALGAGKTELSRAIIHALGFPEEVPSPTFNLVQIYTPPPTDRTTPEVWHMDLYRLERPEEAFELGIEEAFDSAVSLIEWPARLGPYLPTGFLTLRLDIAGADGKGGARKLTILGDRAWQIRLRNLLPHE